MCHKVKKWRLFKCTFVDFCSVRKTYVNKNENEGKQVLSLAYANFLHFHEYISYISISKDYMHCDGTVTRLTQFPFKFPLSLSFMNSCCFAIQLYRSSPVFIGLVQ